MRGWRTPPRLAALLAVQQQTPNIAVNDNHRKRPRASGQIEKARQRRCNSLQAASSALPAELIQPGLPAELIDHTDDHFSGGEGLVNRRVEIWWDGDGEWYPGTIRGFSQGKKGSFHHLFYDDEEEEMIELTKETWRMSQVQAAAEEAKQPVQTKARSKPSSEPKPRNPAAPRSKARSKGKTADKAQRKKKGHKVVWAKMKGHPWWPAKLFPEAEQTKPSFKYVFFFGTGQWGMLPDSDVLPYDGDFARFAPGKKSGKSAAWERAVADASQMWLAR